MSFENPTTQIEESAILFEEPNIEYVPVEYSSLLAKNTSDCTEDAYQTGYQMCGCTNSPSDTEAQCSDGYV